MTVEPAYQEIEITENDAAVDAVLTFKNQSDNPQQVELFAYDFKQTDHFGSLALLDGINNNYLHTLVSYLSFEKDSVIIQAHSEEEVVVKIKNRVSLSPGGHYAAVIARSVDDRMQSQQKILPAISSLLLVRKVGGERVNLSLKEILWDPKFIVTHLPEKVELMFENGGNIHVAPRGTIKIIDVFGRTVSQGIINDSSLYLLPGTFRRIPVTLQPSRPFFPVMLFFLDASGSSDKGEIAFHSELSFLYVDWRGIILLSGLFGFIVAFLTYTKRKKHAKK